MDVDHECQLKQRGCGSPAPASRRGTTSARDCVPAAAQPSSISQPVREEWQAAVLGFREMPTKTFRFSAIAEASSATIAPNDNERLARKSTGCGRPARIRGMHPVDRRLRNTLSSGCKRKRKTVPDSLACTSLWPLHRAATQKGSAVRIFGSQHALPGRESVRLCLRFGAVRLEGLSQKFG
jgi:hypothetical protein